MPDEIELYDALRDTTFFIYNGDRQLLDQFNLTVPRYFALKHTHNNPGLSLTDLSGLMRTDKSNATRLIRSLHKEGLIERRRSESDRRTYCLYLSDKGKKLFQRAFAAHKTYTEDRFSTLNIEFDVFLSYLVAINKKLEQDLDGEG